MEDIELIGSQEALEPTSSAPTSQPSQDTSTAVSILSSLPKPPVQKSWVWDHFHLTSDQKQARCQVPDKEKKGEPCNQLLVRGEKSSTKSLIQHLKHKHQLYPPPKETTGLMFHPNILKRQRLDQRQILNVGMLKQAITYFIAEADLPYAIVERKSFIYLLELLNPSTANMEYGRKTIANEIDLLFYAHKNELRQTLKGNQTPSFHS
ncbi:hypothetical protein Pst134EB_008439 [Puccinia striiformis f. sp. tritici]|nr:hypothetical protein Pst134EB_008439 [Puccinia striiformis f. sp. tritici]